MTGATLDDARTVIALLDQSPLDECAARYAARIAGPTGRLLLIHTADALLQHLSEHKADLVVMAMPAGHGFADRTSGCVAMHVLLRSAVPVCVVRPGRGALGPRRSVPRPRVLVPLDGSEFAEAALPEAGKLASMLGGQLVLLRVVPLLSSLPPPGALGWDISALDRLQAEAWPYLRGVAERCTGEFSCACRTEVRLGASADAILGAVDDEPAAAVVMATHAHSGWQRLLMGSVTDHVLRKCTVPVVLIGPRARVGRVAQTPPAAAQHVQRSLRPSYRL
jgi:nucleotide-binding universal stress UspA family protein